jgi:hypothetical protein
MILEAGVPWRFDVLVEFANVKSGEGIEIIHQV